MVPVRRLRGFADRPVTLEVVDFTVVTVSPVPWLPVVTGGGVVAVCPPVVGVDAIVVAVVVVGGETVVVGATVVVVGCGIVVVVATVVVGAGVVVVVVGFPFPGGAPTRSNAVRFAAHAAVLPGTDDGGASGGPGPSGVGSVVDVGTFGVMVTAAVGRARCDSARDAAIPAPPPTTTSATSPATRALRCRRCRRRLPPTEMAYS